MVLRASMVLILVLQISCEPFKLSKDSCIVYLVTKSLLVAILQIQWYRIDSYLTLLYEGYTRRVNDTRFTVLRPDMLTWILRIEAVGFKDSNNYLCTMPHRTGVLIKLKVPVNGL